MTIHEPLSIGPTNRRVDALTVDHGPRVVPERELIAVAVKTLPTDRVERTDDARFRRAKKPSTVFVVASTSPSLREY